MRFFKMNKSGGYRICSVRDCKKTSKNSNCRFFNFPKNNERLRQWAIACHRDDLLEKKPENIYSTNRVCSNHFEDRMYANDLKNRLLPLAQPTLNLGENLENDRNNVNSANVKTNISSDIRQTTHSLEEEKKLQLSPEYDVRAEHNYVGLEPINITANSLEPSVVVFVANNNSMADLKIAVTAGSSGVEDHRGAQLPLNESVNQNIHQSIQTTKISSAHTPKISSAHTPKKLKLQQEIRILKKENAALHEIIKKMADVTEDQFLKACEKFLPPQVALFVSEQVLSSKKKV